MLKDLFTRKQELYSREVIDSLKLIRSENVGPRTFFDLVKMFRSPLNAIENIAELSLRGGLSKSIKIVSKVEIEKELDLLKKHNAHLIDYTDPLYSSMLLQIFDFPPVLTYKGNIELLNCKKTIAVIGSRAASINGKNFAASLSKELIKEGFITVSGLARGIDTAAHEADASKTIAVIAGGIDNIYPPENKKLYEKIANEGLIISELKIGTKPLAKHFPQRNRLISGISLGVCVIEASLNSGSLITARCALEQNRDVFAVPGFPSDPRYQGTNKLIKQGAYVMENTGDVLSNINYYENKQKSFEFEEIKANRNGFENSNISLNITDSMRKNILNSLSATPVNFEYLAQESNLELPIIHIIILELELAGKIVRLPGNKISYIY